MSQRRLAYIVLIFLSPLCLLRQKIRETVLGPDHPHTATISMHLADLYMMAGHREEARSIFQKVYEVRRKAFGDDNPQTRTALKRLSGKDYLWSNPSGRRVGRSSRDSGASSRAAKAATYQTDPKTSDNSR